jgi:hypothetical protein
MDPFCPSYTSSSVNPLDGAVTKVSWLLDEDAVRGTAVAGGRGPEGIRCCWRSREPRGGS